jgi:MtrB/PioB family decaheme-associated outer membrane protein
VNKRHLATLIAALFAATPVFAEDDPFLSTGSVTAGGIFTDSNAKDASKFQEYQDLSNGMLSSFGVTGRNSRSWLDAYGENFGRDDLYVNIRGGMYDVFKARAYTNWIPHNFLFNGLTPYSGSGGSSLSATFPQPNPATWNGVNLGYERKDTGGYFEWQQATPWYLRIEGNQVKTEGTKVGAASNGLSPGNGYVDLAIPVNYQTNNAAVEMGYATKAMTLSASYLVSNFGNKPETLAWTNPFWGNGVDTTYLAPNNNYQRIGLNAVWRQLPMDSTFALRYTWDQTTSDVNVANSALNGIGAASTILLQPNTSMFYGDESRQTFTLGWSARPAANLDTRVYLNWQEMKNDGTHIVYCASGATTCGGTFENELWKYDKENIGFDAYYRLDKANRIGGGFDYNHVTQNRVDFDDTRTNTFWVEWKSTSLDNVVARFKYSYIDRSSSFLLGNAGTGPNEVAYLSRFVRAFDLANMNQNRLKVTLDWAAMDGVGVAAEYIYKDTDYGDTTLGRTSDTRNEIFMNMTYGSPSSARLTLFADYEAVKYNSDHRYIGASPTCTAATGPNCFDPGNPNPNANAYNWSASVKNNNWLLGLGVDFPVSDKLSVVGSLMYEQVDGSSDMSAQQNFGNPLPLPNYPNIKTTSLNIKGIYKFDRNWSFTAGYAYQKYDYKDDQYNGYTNTIPYPGVSNNVSQSYLNGWNAFQSYDANIVYLLGTFRF